MLKNLKKSLGKRTKGNENTVLPNREYQQKDRNYSKEGNRNSGTEKYKY